MSQFFISINFEFAPIFCFLWANFESILSFHTFLFFLFPICFTLLLSKEILPSLKTNYFLEVWENLPLILSHFIEVFILCLGRSKKAFFEFFASIFQFLKVWRTNCRPENLRVSEMLEILNPIIFLSASAWQYGVS